MPLPTRARLQLSSLPVGGHPKPQSGSVSSQSKSTSSKSMSLVSPLLPFHFLLFLPLQFYPPESCPTTQLGFRATLEKQRGSKQIGGAGLINLALPRVRGLSSRKCAPAHTNNQQSAIHSRQPTDQMPTVDPMEAPHRHLVTMPKCLQWSECRRPCQLERPVAGTTFSVLISHTFSRGSSAIMDCSRDQERPQEAIGGGGVPR